ncbi:hypothetical protein P7K49_012838 [Saguinus oedipus]|uniref:Uncharacterized protein n=1 Tax=Saguinus oedipus TaxID=9490 RepID=A0ABQ9VE66_SAGOE|nr:hypothetical protein P7K49_012838 [Saguinus oedipus]
MLPGDTARREERENEDASVPGVREHLRPWPRRWDSRQGGRVHPGRGSAGRVSLTGLEPRRWKARRPERLGPGERRLQGSGPAGRAGELEAPAPPRPPRCALLTRPRAAVSGTLEQGTLGDRGLRKPHPSGKAPCCLPTAAPLGACKTPSLPYRSPLTTPAPRFRYLCCFSPQP